MDAYLRKLDADVIVFVETTVQAQTILEASDCIYTFLTLLYCITFDRYTEALHDIFRFAYFSFSHVQVTAPTQPSTYKVAILSKLPFSKLELYDIPWTGRKVIAAELKFTTKKGL